MYTTSPFDNASAAFTCCINAPSMSPIKLGDVTLVVKFAVVPVTAASNVVLPNVFPSAPLNIAKSVVLPCVKTSSNV
jgi:hypothetical protein